MTLQRYDTTERYCHTARIGLIIIICRYSGTIRQRQWYSSVLCTRAAAVLYLFLHDAARRLFATLAFRSGSGQLAVSSTCSVSPTSSHEDVRCSGSWPSLCRSLCTDGTYPGRRPAALQSVPECHYPLWPDGQLEEDRSHATTSQPSHILAACYHGRWDCSSSSGEVLLSWQHAVIGCEHWQRHQLTTGWNQSLFWHALQTPGDDHGIRLDTKVVVYKAVILTALLYGSETWVVYRRHVLKLKNNSTRVASDTWHTSDVKKRSKTRKSCRSVTCIEALLMTAQLRWTGHVLRMCDNRLPKAIFCSELEEGTRSRGWQETIQYTIHAEGQLEALQHCTSRARRASTGSVRLAIALQDLSPAVWSRSCPDTGNQAETAEDRDLIAASFPCDVCGRSCASRIWL